MLSCKKIYNVIYYIKEMFTNKLLRYNIHANKYKFNKSISFNFLNLISIHRGIQVLGILALLYDTTFFFISFWLLCLSPLLLIGSDMVQQWKNIYLYITGATLPCNFSLLFGTYSNTHIRFIGIGCAGLWIKTMTVTQYW